MTDYSQNDERWKNNKIGFDTGPSDTIGNYGCYLTAIANVCSWAGRELTPQQINDLCKQNGWFVASDLIAIDDAPARLCNNLTFNGRTNWNDAVSMNFFADASSTEVAYIIKIDASKAPGLQSHFVMVWKTLGDNDLEIIDSWDGVKKPLSHYGNPSVITYSATKFTRNTVTSPPPPPPVQVSIPPVPYTPPAAPVQANMAEQYTLVTALPYYKSPQDVQNNQNPAGTLQKGTYFVWGKEGTNRIYWNLSGSNTKDAGQWVNILNNTVPVAKSVITSSDTPAPVGMTTSEIRASYRSIPDGPMDVSAKTNILVTDIVGSGVPITVREGTVFHIYGTFRKNEQWYAMPKIDATDPQAANYMYGIPISSSTSLEPFLEAAYGYPERISYGVAAFYDKIQKTIEGIWHPQKTKK